MMAARSYEASRTIEAPATVVWDLLTDADSYADWNSAVISIRGPIVEGGSIELVSIVNPKRTFKLRVTELRAPNRMVWSDGMPLGLFTGERTYDLVEADGDAGVDLGVERCELTMREAFTGPLAPLITRAIPDLTDSFETFVGDLKAAAEARQRR